MLAYNVIRSLYNETYAILEVTATPGQYKSLPRDFDNKYQLTYGLESSPHLPKRCPPSPPRRQSSRDASNSSVVGGTAVGDVVIDCSGPVPTATCDDHHLHQHHHQHHHLLHHASPPPPAPTPASSTPPQLNRPPPSMSRSWGSVSVSVNEEHELIATLALQHRNGSDASFKVCCCESSQTCFNAIIFLLHWKHFWKNA